MTKTVIERFLCRAVNLQRQMVAEERANEYLPQAIFIGEQLVKQMESQEVSRADRKLTSFLYFLELGGFFEEFE